MGTGLLKDVDLKFVLRAVEDVPGDLAELGVYQGGLLSRLATWAFFRGVVAHGFDSFEGVGDPGPMDLDGYERGALACSEDEVRARLLERHVPKKGYRLWPGWIPASLEDAGDLVLRFVYLDLDHHDPTAAAIPWALSQLAPGGIVGFDDWFPGLSRGVTPAIVASGILGSEVVHVTRNAQVFFRPRG